MKRFTFRFDSILRLREREEEAAREALERFVGAQRRAAGDLDDASLELDRCEQAIATRRAGSSSVNDHLILLNAARFQRAHCDRLAARLESATRETDAHRALFELARRKHEAVLRLRDRHHRAHAAAGQRHEENEISDLIIAHHAPAESRCLA
jgi:flagellar export protein FliJ